uniref:CSON015208 protein n=1 Tax=Culicoides sonorensis TaxID=179676 RepID=A0A336MH24_CULSO
MENKSEKNENQNQTPAAPSISSNRPPNKGRYNILRDPNTAPARIYIGNVSEQTTEEDLKNKFGKYGQIVGISVNRGFAFLQFMTKDSAQAAIENENKTLLHDKIIAVRTAVKRNDEIPPGSGPNQAQTSQSGNIPAASPSSTSIASNNGTFSSQSTNSNNNKSIYSNFNRTFESNDVEIIVMTRELTMYAERIESCLRNLRFKVDLLYPNVQVPMAKILSNIASRGTLYAIQINQENMNHQSVTLNVLYGVPIEHRNMPVKLALEFVEKDMKKYLETEKLKETMSSDSGFQQQISLVDPVAAIQSLTEPISDPIRNLLKLLIENKPLTVLQYDRLISHLNERRTLQVKAELGEDGFDLVPKLNVPETPIISKAEEEMQKKIKDIISQANYLDTLEAKRGPFKMTDEVLKLLQNPKIERALDSLLHPDVFPTLKIA